MKTYKNVMETIVEDALDVMGPHLDCCMCEQCRNDMAAYALNHLPCRYVVSKSGSVISKVNQMRGQHQADVRTVLLQAAEIIKKYPRHEES